MLPNPNTPNHLADDWAEIQEAWTDALRDYQQTNPELIDLMETNSYFKTMMANVFANGFVRGKMAGATKATDDE